MSVVTHNVYSVNVAVVLKRLCGNCKSSTLNAEAFFSSTAARDAPLTVKEAQKKRGELVAVTSTQIFTSPPVDEKW